MTENHPLHCHICNNKFEIELGKGGVCDNCSKPTCNRHLSSTHKVEEKDVYICSDCLSKSTDM